LRDEMNASSRDGCWKLYVQKQRSLHTVEYLEAVKGMWRSILPSLNNVCEIISVECVQSAFYPAT
jgi:hypothetical protein